MDEDYDADENSWGLQAGKLSLEDSISFGFDEDSLSTDEGDISLGSKFSFPLELIYQVIFVGGKRGSGKSWSSAVMMEEFNRHGLQFVCFDALDAHGHLAELNGIESIEPQKQESINMKKLIERLQKSGASLIINMSGLSLEMQQRLVSEYCEGILETAISDKGLMTILEECQDFIPQLGRPESFAPIVRLCKLGRSKGYGVSLISQRPAAVSKEALSQASVYMIHNIINTKDLNALKEQLSFGTDKATIDKILSGITYAEAGDMVCYAPEFYKDQGYVVVGRVDKERRTEHKGKNIDVTSNLNADTFSPISFNRDWESDTPETQTPSTYSFSDDIYDSDEEEIDIDDDDDLFDDVPKYEWTPNEVEKLYANAPKLKSNVTKGVALVAFASSAFYVLSRVWVSNKRG